MTTNNPQDKLINFAMSELTKVLQDVKQGKVPEMSATMQKLASKLEMANETRKTMTDEEVKTFAETLVQEISNLDE
jgi:hypothetical protein